MRNGEDEQAAKVSPTPRELCSLGFQYCSQGDFGRAEAVYREAAAKGYANAQYNLAVLIKKKLSTSRALKAKRTSIEAAGWFSEAALQGHARAAFQLGRAYQKGAGVEKSDEEALRWYLIAANAGGLDEAQHLVGIMLFEGIGTGQDHAAAAGFLRRAAQQGHAAASARLGAILWQGFEGTPRNRSEAVELFLHAASGGDAESQHILGVLCLEGTCGAVAQSDREGREWLLKAARQGHEASQWRLGLSCNKLDKESSEWFRKSVGKAAARTAAAISCNATLLKT